MYIVAQGGQHVLKYVGGACILVRKFRHRLAQGWEELEVASCMVLAEMGR